LQKRAKEPQAGIRRRMVQFSFGLIVYSTKEK
jgi:hypothetical protein